MCKRCIENRRLEQERKLRLEEEKRLAARVGIIHHKLTELLTIDKIKGSEYMRLREIATSKDQENLTVVEEIISHYSCYQII
jgi:hypothetical protein